MNRIHTVVYSVLALGLVYLGTRLSATTAQLKEKSAQVLDLTQEVETEKKKIESLQVEKTRVIVVTKPSGEKIVTTETSKETKSVQTEEAQKEVATVHDTKETKKESKPALSPYSFTAEWSSLQSFPTGFAAGARLGDSPLWAEGGWDKKAGLHLGIRIEF